MSARKTVEDLIEKDSEVKCPSCGHFAGVYETCPRCGATVNKRTSLKIIRYFALVLSTVGLFFMYLWAVNRELPVIKVSEIGPTMNFAQVRIKGYIITRPRYRSEYGRISGISFQVSDNKEAAKENIIRVGIYGDGAAQVVARKSLLCPGDEVDMQGKVQVKDGEKALMIKTAQHLLVNQRAVVPLKEITQEATADEVKLRACIVGILKPEKPNSKKPIKIMLTDGEHLRQATMWQNVYQELSEQKKMKRGQIIELYGQIDRFGGKPQIKIDRKEDILIVDQDSWSKDEQIVIKTLDKWKWSNEQKSSAAGLFAVHEVNNSHDGRTITIEGKLVKQFTFAKGEKWLIASEKGTLQVVVWQTILDEMRQKPAINSQVRITGKIKSFRGKLELSPFQKDNIFFAAPAPIPVPEQPAKIFKPGEVTAELAGKTITIEGKLLREFTFSKGKKWFVEEDGKTLTIVLWNSVCEELKEKYLVGDRVQITGKVKNFRNKLELSPYRANDIAKIDSTKPTAKVSDDKTVEMVKVVGKEHVGKKVRFQGIIVQQFKFSKGVNWIVSNEHGKVKVVVWNKTLEQMAVKPVPGFSIIVTALVKEYREKLSLYPFQAKDIVVTGKKFDAIGDLQDGQLAIVQGKVLDRQVIPAGVRMGLEGSTGKIDIVMTQEQFHLHKYYYNIGAGFHIQAKGTVISYQGKFQLKPAVPNDIKILEVPASPKKEKKSEAKLIEVTGITGGSYIIPPGIKISLKEVTGLPDSIKADNLSVILRGPKLTDVDTFKNMQYGSKVRVSGKLGQFRDMYQVEIPSIDNIQILEPAPIREKKPYQPKERKPIKINQQPVEQESWQNVSLSQLSKITSGTPIRVQGTITESNGNWKLIDNSFSIHLSANIKETSGTKVVVYGYMLSGQIQVIKTEKVLK